MPNGSILNLSRRVLWVVETDSGRAIAHKLGPNLKSPPSVDCDGVKAVDGTPISNHNSWWKFRVIQVEVWDDGSGLKIRWCAYPACFSVSEGEFGDVTYDNSTGWGVPILQAERESAEAEMKLNPYDEPTTGKPDKQG